MFDKLRWLFACSWAHSNKVQQLSVISPPGSLATNELSTMRSHLTTSNLMRQWIKEQGMIPIYDSIWLGANLIKLSWCGGELGGGELAMGRNRQLPFIDIFWSCYILICICYISIFLRQKCCTPWKMTGIILHSYLPITTTSPQQPLPPQGGRLIEVWLQLVMTSNKEKLYDP